MAKRSVIIWICLIIPTIMVVGYVAYLGAVQEKRVEKLHYLITSRGRHYWDKFQLPPLFGLTYRLFFSHDFEKKDEHGQVHQTEVVDKGNEGIKNKLIEAVEESLEKTKLMMEDSAKSAADMAGEVVHKTADKLLQPRPKLASPSQPHDEL